MKIQIREYIQFIKKFVEQTDIMSKSFFVVVPFSPSIIGSDKSPLAKFGAKNAGVANSFEEYRMQLEQRVSAISQGLSRCGIRSILLGNEEVIELFYKSFNPGELDKPMMAR